VVSLIFVPFILFWRGLFCDSLRKVNEGVECGKLCCKYWLLPSMVGIVFADLLLRISFRCNVWE